MNDFKRNDRFGDKRMGGGFGGRPSFGGKPAFQRSGGGFGGRPQGQMHPATCAQCGKPCEVPFRPDGSRPIYCRDCFSVTKPSGPMRDSQRPAFKTFAPAPVKPQAPDPRIDVIQRQLAKIEAKLDQVLISLAVGKAQASAKPATAKKKTAKKK